MVSSKIPIEMLSANQNTTFDGSNSRRFQSTVVKLMTTIIIIGSIAIGQPLRQLRGASLRPAGFVQPSSTSKNINRKDVMYLLMTVTKSWLICGIHSDKIGAGSRVADTPKMTIRALKSSG